MKPLLIAATLSLSIVGASGSAPALAETISGNTSGGGFRFFDDILDNSSTLEGGFAALGVALKMDQHPDLNVHYITAYLDPNNPMTSNPGADIAMQAYYYSMYPNGNPWYEREQYSIDNSLDWVYIKDDEDSIVPFDRDAYRAEAYLTLPLSTFGIFDFENSFVFYEGETEGVSLAQIFAQLFAPGQPVSPGVAVEIRPKENNFWVSWVDDREIVAVSLTYNLNAIPEPETWAMLLAGLGIVGAVTRRRHSKTAA
jgi:hypothetical protein